MECQCRQELENVGFKIGMQDSRIESWEKEQDREWKELALVRDSDRDLFRLVLLIQLVCTLAICGAMLVTWLRVDRLETRIDAMGGWVNE